MIVDTGVGSKTPLAAWWPGDKQLLALDTTHRNAIAALIGAPWRAPVWLAMSEIDLEHSADDQESPTRELYQAGAHPIVVQAELQEAVRRHSGPMTLSSNGIHDSHGPEFLAAVRPFLKSGAATPEAVALAALRAGWWPEKIPALLRKL